MAPQPTTETLVKCVAEALAGARSRIAFAYLHGSALTAACPQDVDVAVFLDPAVYSELAGTGSVHMGFAIPLEMELESALRRAVDVQVLNGAPLPFRYRVIASGVLIADHEPRLRYEFEYLARCEYFDFRPRREEYLAEVMA